MASQTVIALHQGSTITGHSFQYVRCVTDAVRSENIAMQAQVLDLLSELQARLGTALLFISHDLGVVQHVADRGTGFPSW
jgi:ABC-type methionine transport system ATPase subunit